MKEVVTYSWNKKGISIMIGYILLITGAVVMSAIVYQYLKSYIPKETIDCPDGVSLFIVNSNCSEQADGNYELRLNIRNNGRFDVGGYYIKATDSPNQDLATVDLTDKIVYGGQASNNAIVFVTSSSEGVSNFLNPTDEISGVFSNISNKLYSVELIPVRYQVIDNKKQLVSCGNSRIVEDINCDVEIQEEEEQQCTPDCTNKDCGSDGCGGSCGTCDSGFKCETNSCVEDLCGNGVWVADGEQCDDNNTDDGDGCSSECIKESGYECVGEPSVCS